MRAFPSVLILVVLCLVPTVAPAQTDVSGNLYTQTWTAAGSPYRITGSVMVVNSNVITIEPGVDVLFDADVALNVLGSIRAVGTETDSIRFLLGLAAQFGGICFSNTDSSTFHYVRVSGAVADMSTPYNAIHANSIRLGLSDCVFTGNSGVQSSSYGGCLYFGGGAKVTMDRCRVANNSAIMRGGGLYVNGATLTATNTVIENNTAGPTSSSGAGLYSADSQVKLVDCVISGNDCGSGSGGAAYVTGTNTVSLERCLIVNNAANLGGGVYAGTGGTVEITNCTITGNGDGAANTADGIYLYTDATVTAVNTILWGNEDGDWYGTGTLNASYSDVGTAATGDGVFSDDPQFNDAANGDYTLSIESPCVNAGDPDSPFDPDLSPADIGVFPTDQGPALRVGDCEVTSGDAVEIPVLAHLGAFYGVEFAFTIDTTYCVPSDPFITGDEVAAQGGATEWNTSEDTVFVASASASEITVGETLMTLHLKLKHNVQTNVTVPVEMVWDRVEIDESGINSYDGDLTISLVYGDVSMVDGVTVDDASLILQEVVGHAVALDEAVADVSDNGAISAYDAALVLYKVVNPAYTFPCEAPGPLRPAADGERLVRFEKSGDVWSLLVNDAGGIAAGSFTVVLPDGAAADVSGAGLVVARQEGSVLEVAFARIPSDEGALFEIRGLTCCAPAIMAGQLNEGRIVVAENAFATPASFSLYQNSPNPFNPATTVRFAVPGASHVRLTIHNTAGQLVRTLVDEQVAAGAHAVVWDGRDDAGRNVASGVYAYRVVTDRGTMTRRMTLLR